MTQISHKQDILNIELVIDGQKERCINGIFKPPTVSKRDFCLITAYYLAHQRNIDIHNMDLTIMDIDLDSNDVLVSFTNRRA